MWQQIDGGKNDKYVWVEETIGTGSNGAPPPAGGFNPMEGAISMGFYNINPFTDASGHARPGDAPFFKSLADQYAISDNYHQAIMGGTGANFQALVTGHAAFFTNPDRPDGSAAVPFANQIENPESGRRHQQLLQAGRLCRRVLCELFRPECARRRLHDEQLLKNGVHHKNCAPNHYYLVNNYNMYWNQTSNRPNLLGPDKFILPPQSAPTIADVMTAKGISWKYYSSDRGATSQTLQTLSMACRCRSTPIAASAIP